MFWSLLRNREWRWALSGWVIIGLVLVGLGMEMVRTKDYGNLLAWAIFGTIIAVLLVWTAPPLPRNLVDLDGVMEVVDGDVRAWKEDQHEGRFIRMGRIIRGRPGIIKRIIERMRADDAKFWRTYLEYEGVTPSTASSAGLRALWITATSFEDPA